VLSKNPERCPKCYDFHSNAAISITPSSPYSLVLFPITQVSSLPSSFILRLSILPSFFLRAFFWSLQVLGSFYPHGTTPSPLIILKLLSQQYDFLERTSLSLLSALHTYIDPENSDLLNSLPLLLSCTLSYKTGRFLSCHSFLRSAAFSLPISSL